MIDISKLLYEIVEDDRVYDLDFDLIDSGLLDSLSFIELFYKLEDLGINIVVTRIDKEEVRTPRKIQELIRRNNE